MLSKGGKRWAQYHFSDEYPTVSFASYR